MSWLYPFRLGLESALQKFGYELKEKIRPLRGPKSFLAHIDRRGFRPRTLIDIGVAFGTPWLYEAFPASYLVLIEPNEDFTPHLEKICAQYRGEFHIFAAGASEFVTNLKIDLRVPSSSSLLNISAPLQEMLEANHGPSRREEKFIRVRPLDSVYRKTLEEPILIKIDTEGYEHCVVAGASEFLDHTELIIAEVNVRKRFEESYLFNEFIEIMKSKNFHLFDVVDLGQFGSDGPLMYMDAVFVKEGSSLW